MKKNVHYWDLTIVTLYFILGKDLLRFLENYYNTPIPLNLIPFSLVGICVFINMYELKTRSLCKYHFMALLIICIDFIALSINFLIFFKYNMREVAGIIYIHLLIPLFVILTSNKINYYKIFFREKKLFPILLIIVSVGTIQLCFFKLFPEASIQILSELYNKGWIHWPFQVSSVGIYLRPMSIFYASFPFGLFLIFLLTVLIFSTIETKRKLIVSTLLILLLLFLGNRNTYLALAILASFKLIGILGNYKQKAIGAGVLLILLGITNIFTPFILKELPTAYFNNDKDPFTKTTTIGSRVKAWIESTKSLDEDFLFGHGVIQGSNNATTLADNFLIYKIQQNGFLIIIFWFFFFLLIIFAVIKSLLRGHTNSLLAASLLGSFLIMANFNNLFYEPVFQCLYMGTLLGILREVKV